MYPDHPNLLPAAWSARKVGKDHVVKPVHGWEGAGVRVVLVTQPYRMAGRRAPAPAAQLDEAWTAVIEHIRVPGLPLIFGGR